MAHVKCKEYAPNFVKCISQLQNTFNERFHDFHLQEQNIIEAENAPTGFQMEQLELQYHESIKKKFDEIPVEKFYRKYVLSEKFPQFKENTALIIFLFGSTYVCVQMLSRIKHIKNKNRSSIYDGLLEHCLRLATTSLAADNDF